MLKLLPLIILMSLLTSCDSHVKTNDKRLKSNAQSSTANSQQSIVILYDNDVHCAVDGYAKLVALRDIISDTAGFVTTVSCGDFASGGVIASVSDGELIVDIMNKVDYDVVTPGNHEARIYKSDGLDITQIMCNQLGIGERYSSASVLLIVRFGKTASHEHGRPVCYTIYQVHGSGGGRLEGGKINRLIQLASIVDADVYIHSHVHTPAIVKTAYFRPSLQNNSVMKVDRLFINTSSTLEYGGYGEVQSYKPNSTETPLIILDGSRRRMRAIL